MKFIETIMTPLLMILALAMVLLSAPLSHTTEIEGDWQANNPSGNTLLFYFGKDHTFFFESETSWFQGTYAIQQHIVSKQLAIYIEDGSIVEDVGRELRYRYDIHDNSLILSVTDATEPFEGQDSSDRYVYIGINNDSSDEDDNKKDSNFSIYASCFVTGLSSSSDKGCSDPKCNFRPATVIRRSTLEPLDH